MAIIIKKFTRRTLLSIPAVFSLVLFGLMRVVFGDSQVNLSNIGSLGEKAKNVTGINIPPAHADLIAPAPPGDGCIGDSACSGGDGNGDGGGGSGDSDGSGGDGV